MGIMDRDGKVKEEIRLACKALQMDVSDFEPVSFDDCLRKQHDLHF